MPTPKVGLKYTDVETKIYSNIYKDITKKGGT